jgi:hypothetical protein
VADLRKGLAMALMAALMLGLIVSQASAQRAPEPIRVDRDIVVTNWGTVILIDRIYAKSASPEAIEVGFPGRMASSLRQWRAVDRSGAEIAARESAEAGARWLSAALPAEGEGSRSLTLYTVFEGLLSYGALKFYLGISPFPMLKDPIENCTIRILLPGDAKVSVREGSIFSVGRAGMALILNASLSPMEPYLDEEFVIEFTSYEQGLLKVDSIARSMELEESGDVVIRDSYSVRNLCQRSLDGVMVPLAKGAEQVRAEDGGGPLPQTLQRGPGDSLNVTVRPRFKSVRFSEGFSFTVSFRIPKGEVAKLGEGFGQRGIDLDLLPPIPGIVENASATISLPRGFSLKSAEPAPRSAIEGTYANKLIYGLGPVSPAFRPKVRLQYAYNPFWSALRPVGWALAIEAMAIGAASIRISKRAARPRARPLVDLLNKFIGLCGEKGALRLSLGKMEDDLARGGIGKNEYRRRRKLVEGRIREIERALAPMKEELKRADPRYAELIRGMERAEAELEAAKASELQLRAQYRSGKISREVYGSLLSASKKRGEKAEKEIEAALLSLRGDAR